MGLLNRDYADKRFLQAQSLARAIEGSGERISQVMLLAALALYGLVFAISGVGQPNVVLADPSVRVDRG